ncbi:DUF3320 domain-containing protein [Ponticaulis sp.]|uniref:DUF3320 domain-containing protein n=1 Tax=Ponticaulis sp. TaxID=2020902 RepID=UPI000B664226|nr:DUF3320 domain-containing protein [Ponticaulis sp.]OUX97022.1 MAG: DNA helicase [Hyphomonadaceae bacterium TMED5]
MSGEATSEHQIQARIIQVDIDSVSKINFASAQNGVSILKQLSVSNGTPDTVAGLSITLNAKPAFCRSKTWTIDRLNPGDEIVLSDLKLELDHSFLSGLNEAEIGHIEVSCEADGDVVCDQVMEIELLARDEWGGLGDMSQLLAAYVSPNHSVVAAILKEASRLLESAGHNGAIDGYQSKDPQRAWMLSGAIWSAITGMGLSYANPPASFESRGQKVRDPQRIKSEGLTTCLDSSLLLAACFEASGMHPVVLFSSGHAWVGVWLQPLDFGTVTEFEILNVRKAVDAQELILLESTLLTHRPTVGLKEAADTGRRLVNEEHETEYAAAIDIARARAARIRPLASYFASNTSDAAEQIEAAPASLPAELSFNSLPGDTIEVEPTDAQGRIERWQRKLLDLSLRNRLLNYKDSKQTLPFICPDVGALEDQLADGKSFKGFPLKEEDPLGTRDQLLSEERDLLKDVARDAFNRSQLSVPLTSGEMNKRFLELYRRAKSDMQEGGTNTLFLAAGFLRWKKSEGDPRTYKAPLLLIPVKLERRSAQSDFVLSHHEDDVRINSTLLEFLKRDFDLKFPDLEGELPRDDSGIDLPLIFERMRRGVRDVAGFEVVQDLALSTFSFAKFLMWKDLVDRTDDLKHSELVKYLIENPEKTFQEIVEGNIPDARDVDRRVAPKDLMTPLPADSSQLSAVLAAQDGLNFVLIGPPGTGKSQTIANIISQCLGSGKTVLFVAEKSAALDVVHRRLAANGLGDAVVELHSSKADRKSVLQQLDRSWDRMSRTSEQEWTDVTERLKVRRDQLNDYVGALHALGSQGFSVYQAIGRVVSYDAEIAPLSFPTKDAHDQESYRRLKELSSELGRHYEIVSQMPPLDLVKATDWSHAFQTDLLARAKQLVSSAEKLLSAYHHCRASLGLAADDQGHEDQLQLLRELAHLPADRPDIEWVMDKDFRQLRSELERLASFQKQHTALESQLQAQYPLSELEKIPLEQLDTDWRIAQTKMWPLSAFAKSRTRKLLQTYASGGKASPETDLDALTKLQATQNEIRTLSISHCPAYDGPLTDIERLTNWLKLSSRVRKLIGLLSEQSRDCPDWERARRAIIGGDGESYEDALLPLIVAQEEWGAMATQFTELSKGELSGSTLSELSRKLRTVLDNRDGLLNWVQWQTVRERAENSGLGEFVELVEGGDIEDSVRAFEASYASWWLPLALDASPVLRQFVDWSHEDEIQQFRALDDQATKLASQQVLRRIQHGLPEKSSVPRRSELGTLRHQIGLQRPSMPIRTLISEMPEHFTKLAPCVLMSPLSIAQYLPANQSTFDVVIFDEASQITTWDAVGAIARGKQAIIVGDPKQLPPTNFFGRTDGGEEEIPEFEKDLPSILDEVVAAGIPTLQLDWHYRSRDEALIAFSNWHYYGGRLVTFPGPVTQSSAVQLHQVDGVYARGRGRTNEDEARAIVRMIVSKLNEWLKLPEQDRLTLGVITFNGEQQKLILDLLDEERRKNPELEWFFEDTREEPLIVKNLENIQGDERDVMLFSITFGHDHAGKLSMAFGALNGEGGEKRLNVAVTRARRELHVFASVRSDEIDLTRTKAVGVKHLKTFLDFASRGVDALPANDDGSVGPVENEFEASVLAALEMYGWQVRPQIGVSGFKIDLGVVHPDFAGVYLAGVECDGATYHSSATARDRDKVRQSVLEGLGWKILRVWSTEWFRSSKSVAGRLNEKLQTLLEEDRERRREESESTVQGFDEPAIEQPFVEPSTPNAEDVHNFPPPSTYSPSSVTEVPSDEATLSARSANLFAASTNSAFSDVPNQLNLNSDLDPERFFDADYAPVLISLIEKIIQDDGPMPISSLGRKISAAHGWQRTGRRISERVSNCLAGMEIHVEDGVEFVWTPGTYSTRIPFKPNTSRSLRDISRSEIASVITTNLRGLSVSEDPILDLARLLGVARLSSDARDYLKTVFVWFERASRDL